MKIHPIVLTACLLGSLAVTAQAQSVTKVDSVDMLREAPFVNRANYQYEPIVIRHSNTPSGLYKSGIIFIADQLERNVDPQEKTRSTVVTSFASLDNLQETSAFGRLVGENLSHELHVRGWQINDIRLSRDLIVNADGELGMSRDIKRLRAAVPAANVVTGSYTTSVDGILLSVRVVDFATGQLISSAETRFKGDAFLSSLINKPRSAPLIKISN
jgi:TolB-like protein